MTAILSYVAAGILRYSLTQIEGWRIISDRVEIATPLNSWRRLIEGVYLYDHNIDPYQGDTFHETPLILLLFHCLIKKVPYIIPFLFTLLDLCTAHLLYLTAKSLSEQFKASQKETKIDEIFMHKSQFDELPGYVSLVYLFNPYSILNCSGMTTTVIQNFFLAGTLCSTTRGYRELACLFLALATYQALYPVLLIVPVAIILENMKEGCTKCSYIRTVIIFVLFWGFLTIVSAFLMKGSYAYLNNTYGLILTIPDLKPNIGLFWYFFTEMFEHFRFLFICAFQINALALYVIPLTLKFKDEPMLLATVLIALSTIFRSYPCIGDVGFYLSLLPMWKHLFPFMQQKLIVGCAFLMTSTLGPTVWHLWIHSGSANANFFFGVTLSFATAQIFLLTDLLFAYIRREFTLKHGSSRLIDGEPGKLVLE